MKNIINVCFLILFSSLVIEEWSLDLLLLDTFCWFIEELYSVEVECLQMTFLIYLSLAMVVILWFDWDRKGYLANLFCIPSFFFIVHLFYHLLSSSLIVYRWPILFVSFSIHQLPNGCPFSCSVFESYMVCQTRYDLTLDFTDFDASFAIFQPK